jgi:hypothetical protein
MAMRIEFDTDNAAFEDNPIGEIKAILARVAQLVANGVDEAPVYDTNGNRVGFWTLNKGEWK